MAFKSQMSVYFSTHEPLQSVRQRKSWNASKGQNRTLPVPKHNSCAKQNAHLIATQRSRGIASMSPVPSTCRIFVALFTFGAAPHLALAQDVKPMAFPFALEGAYNEIETKYIFGFTDGSDIGAEGEKAIEVETNGAFRKRHGRYSAIEQEVEFEAVPTQFFAYELSAHGTAHAIKGVDGLDDLHRVTPSGLSAR